MELTHEAECPGERLSQWRERNDDGLIAVLRCKACGAERRSSTTDPIEVTLPDGRRALVVEVAPADEEVNG